MISEKAKLNGAKWRYTKKNFINAFNEASTMMDKKNVIQQLFDLHFEHNTQWEPLALKEIKGENKIELLYSISKIIPAATREDLTKIIIGQAVEKSLILEGFHKYEYVWTPRIQPMLNKLDSFWTNQNYFVMQLYKNEKQLKQYFSQIVRSGIEAQDEFAKEIYNLALSLGYDSQKGLSIRSCDALSASEDANFNAAKSFWTNENSFSNPEDIIEALKNLFRQHASFGSENSLATLVE